MKGYAEKYKNRQIHLTVVSDEVKEAWKAQAEKEGFRTLSAYVAWVVNRHITSQQEAEKQ